MERFRLFLLCLSKAALTLLGSEFDLQSAMFCRLLLLINLLFFPLKCKREEEETKVLHRETSKRTWNFICTNLIN